jgi:hypothetical protein
LVYDLAAIDTLCELLLPKNTVGEMYVLSAIGRLVVKIFAGCYFPLASGKMTR